MSTTEAQPELQVPSWFLPPLPRGQWSAVPVRTGPDLRPARALFTDAEWGRWSSLGNVHRDRALHEDEEVVLGLIHDVAETEAYSRDADPSEDFFGEFVEGALSPDLRQLLWERALRSAGAEGVLWNPLIDACASLELPVDGVSTYFSSGIPSALESRIGAVEEWLRSGASAEQVRLLFDFDFSGVHHAAASSAQNWADDLIDRVLTVAHPALRQLAENPAVTGEHASYLGRVCLNRLMSETATEAECEVLLTLMSRGVWFPDRHVQRDLAGAARRAHLGATSAHYPPWVPHNSRDHLLRFMFTALGGRSDALDPDELFRAALQSPALLASLAREGRLSAEQVREVMASTDGWSPAQRADFQEAIAQAPCFHSDAAVTGALETSEEPSVLALFLSRSEGESFRRAFRQLVVINPQKAVDVLDESEGRAVRCLRRADLTTLLASGNSQHRLRAIRLLAQIREPDAPDLLPPAPLPDPERYRPCRTDDLPF